MLPTIQDAIEHSKQVDLNIQGSNVQKNKELQKVMHAGFTAPQPGVHPSEISITDPDEDPFGGNVNNRRVGERIARQSRREFTNTSKPIHMGDPNKAADDVAQSKRVLPDAVIREEADKGDMERMFGSQKPTPGSPAASKAPISPSTPMTTPKDVPSVPVAHVGEALPSQGEVPNAGAGIAKEQSTGKMAPPVWKPNA